MFYKSQKMEPDNSGRIIGTTVNGNYYYIQSSLMAIESYLLPKVFLSIYRTRYEHGKSVPLRCDTILKARPASICFSPNMSCKERIGIWVIHSVGSSYCARRCHIASRIERFTTVGGMSIAKGFSIDIQDQI